MWYNIDTVWCKILWDARSQDEWLNVRISMLTLCSLWEWGHTSRALMLPTPLTVTSPRVLLTPFSLTFVCKYHALCICWAIFQDTHKSRFVYHYPYTITGSIWLPPLRAVSSQLLLLCLSSPVPPPLTPISLSKHIKLFGSVLIRQRQYFP